MTTYLIIFLVLSVVAFFYFSSKRITKFAEQPVNEKITNLNEANFQHKTKKGIVLIDFWASWCMPCKIMSPILNELADEIDSNASVCKVDVEKEQNLAAKFSVRNIPTLILLKNGQEISRFVGVKQKDFLVKQIRNNY